MPRFLSDAVNYVDAIADAVRDGTGIDDKWFAFSIDWRISKLDPHLEIHIIQSATEHHAWCPRCENLLPESQFYFTKKVRVSECRKCTKLSHQQVHAETMLAKGKVTISKAERARLITALQIKIFTMRQDGMTFQEIADELDISRSHAARVYKRPLSVP